jgi:hypothetical protein
MLKITMLDAGDRVRLELEGKLSGAWVPELEECWRTSNATPQACVSSHPGA